MQLCCNWYLIDLQKFRVSFCSTLAGDILTLLPLQKKMFMILLCIAIGHVYGDLQGAEIGKDDLKARENVIKVRTPYVKEAINLDQYLQSKDDVQVPTQSVSSSETKTDEKPSSLELGSPLTSGAYDVKKSRQNVFFETREAGIRSLLKYSDRNTSSKNDSTMFRSFPVKSILYTGKDLPIKMKSFRRKRDVFDSLNDMLEPVFGILHPKALPKKHRVRPHPQRAHNNTDYTKKEKLVYVKNVRGQEIISRSGSPRTSAASYSAMQYLLNKLPDVLKSKILITDDAEKVVLENYVKSQSVPTEVLDTYNSAKKIERELLKRLLREMPIILPTYKALRKGAAWNYTKLDNKFMKFFQQPSTALEQYETLKSYEFSSLDRFLAASRQKQLPLKVDKAPDAKAGEQKAGVETMSKVVVEHTFQVVDASYDEVEELKREIRQIVGANENVETTTNAVKSETQASQTPEINSSEATTTQMVTEEVKTDVAKNQLPGVTVKSEVAEKQKPEEITNPQKAENQTIQEAKLEAVTVTWKENQMPEEKTKSAETEKDEERLRANITGTPMPVETLNTESTVKQTLQYTTVATTGESVEQKTGSQAKAGDSANQTTQEAKTGATNIAEEGNTTKNPGAEVSLAPIAVEIANAEEAAIHRLHAVTMTTTATTITKAVVEQKAEDKVKAEDAKETNLDVGEVKGDEDDIEQGVEEKAEAGEAEKQAAEAKVKVEEIGLEIGELEAKTSEEYEERNGSTDARPADAEKQKVEKDKLAAAVQTEEQRVENKSKAEEAEREALEVAQEKAVEDAEEEKAEEEAKTDEAETSTPEGTDVTAAANVTEKQVTKAEPGTAVPETPRAEDSEEISKAEQSEEQKFENKSKAEEVEKQALETAQEKAALDAEEEKAEGKAKTEEAKNQTLQSDEGRNFTEKAEVKPGTVVTKATPSAEEIAKPEQAEKQKLQETTIASTSNTTEKKVEEKGIGDETNRNNIGGVEQNAEEKVKAEEVESQIQDDAEQQKLDENKIGTAEEAKEQNAKQNAKVEEAERQKLEETEAAAAEDAKEQKAEVNTQAREMKLNELQKANASVAINLKQIPDTQKPENVNEAINWTKHEAHEQGKSDNATKMTTQKSQEPEKADNANKMTTQKSQEPGKAEKQKAGEVQKQDNATGTMQSDEPFCGPLKVELSEKEKEEILKAHNDARRRERATNMLKMTWDNEIAIIAQYKANTCGYFHSMYKDCRNDTLGQNLFTNFKTSDIETYPLINYTHVTYGWANERADWNRKTSSCREGRICTHWKTVTGAKAWRLGCGKSECPSLNARGKWHKMANFVVCNYGPFSMDFKPGRRCSQCDSSTADLDEKGFICENDLCVQCHPKKNPVCKCGPAQTCYNNGVYSAAEFCSCICPVQYYGAHCEKPCGCEDLNPELCEKWASHCTDQAQKYWLPESCQKTCKTCSLYKRPDSCNSTHPMKHLQRSHLKGL